MSSKRAQRALVAPLALLGMVLLEDMTSYQVRRLVADVRWRTAIFVLLYGVGFAVVAMRLIPWLRRLVLTARRSTRRQGGELGVWLLFAAAYGLVYYAFYVIETRGTAALFPASLR